MVHERVPATGTGDMTALPARHRPAPGLPAAPVAWAGTAARTASDAGPSQGYGRYENAPGEHECDMCLAFRRLRIAAAAIR